MTATHPSRSSSKSTEAERTVIITGMHRSGTSLVASILRRVGVDIGSRLLGPHESNPQGHFEDLDFLDFHKACLGNSRSTGLVREAVSLDSLPEESRERAKELVREKSGSRTWGWKDPRAALFLDLWTDLLPDARWVFVYRHPVDVLLSLLARGTDPEVLQDPTVGLDAWKVYNSAILRQCRRAPDSCTIFDIYDVASDPNGFVATVASRLELDLASVDVTDLPIRGQLRESVRSAAVDSILGDLDREAMVLLRALTDRAEPLDTGEWDRRHLRNDPVLEKRLKKFAAVVSEAAPARGKIVSAGLAFLLAILDPDMESWRNRRIGEELGELRVHVANLQSRVASLTTHARNLEERKQALEAHVANLEAELEEAKKHAANSE